LYSKVFHLGPRRRRNTEFTKLIFELQIIYETALTSPPPSSAFCLAAAMAAGQLARPRAAPSTKTASPRLVFPQTGLGLATRSRLLRARRGWPPRPCRAMPCASSPSHLRPRPYPACLRLQFTLLPSFDTAPRSLPPATRERARRRARAPPPTATTALHVSALSFPKSSTPERSPPPNGPPKPSRITSSPPTSRSRGLAPPPATCSRGAPPSGLPLPQRSPRTGSPHPRDAHRPEPATSCRRSAAVAVPHHRRPPELVEPPPWTLSPRTKTSTR
jgi:hypothetical protein